MINNSVAVEGGVNSGILCADSHCQGLMNVSAHLRWEFHVHPQWTAYVAPGAAVGEVLTRFGTDVKHGLFVSPKIGAFWWLSESNALRLEYDDNLNSHRIGYMFVF